MVNVPVPTCVTVMESEAAAKVMSLVSVMVSLPIRSRLSAMMAACSCASVLTAVVPRAYP